MGGKKAKSWLIFWLCNILDRISSFVYVNEKFYNKNLFFDLFSIVLERFPRFYTTCIIYIQRQ